MTSFAPPRQATLLGLGLFGGGVGAARFLAERGARVIVSDARPSEALAESVAALEGVAVEYRFGGHQEEDFTGSDWVIVNPGVPDDSPGMRMARDCGARLETEINLLFRLCPAPIAAVTGTNGKSTTVALLGEMLRAGGRRTWVGGNLGGSLLPEVARMAAQDVVVLEISSFQAERLAWAGLGPRVGIVMNITPNHLDRHRSMAEYAAAKRQLLAHQGPGDFAILNAADPLLRSWGDAGRGAKFFFGADRAAPRGAEWSRDGLLLWCEGRRETVRLQGLRLPGAHNRFNAGCAAAGAWLLGASPEAIETGLTGFSGLPDRLELVAERDGVRFYNDSIATTPESTMAALEALDAPVVLIAGGSSKNLSYDALGQCIAGRVKALVLLGATAGQIARAVQASGGGPPIHHGAGLEEAVRRAAACAAPGDVVLLSPASASFDMFRNYAERGECFRRIVRAT